MDRETADKLAEHVERVEREEAAWATARLHYNRHGTWLEPYECPVCLQGDLRWEQRLEDARMGLS